MHLADGIVPIELAIAADVVAISASAFILNKQNSEKVVQIALASSLIFLASLIHFPLGPTSVHFALLGMAGIILNLAVIPAIFVAIFFQALIFQHGGIMISGLNTLIMGCGGLSAWLIWKIGRKSGLAYFLSGFCAVIVPTLLIVLLFQLIGYGPGALILIPINLVPAILEGFFTRYIIFFLQKSFPGEWQ